MTLVGNFEELTVQDKLDLEEWRRSDDAVKMFQDVHERVVRESEDFRRRTTLSSRELHSPFTI